MRHQYVLTGAVNSINSPVRKSRHFLQTAQMQSKQDHRPRSIRSSTRTPAPSEILDPKTEHGPISSAIDLELDQAAAHQPTSNVQLVNSKRVTVLVRDNKVP